MREFQLLHRVKRIESVTFLIFHTNENPNYTFSQCRINTTIIISSYHASISSRGSIIQLLHHHNHNNHNQIKVQNHQLKARVCKHSNHQELIQSGINKQ